MFSVMTYVLDTCCHPSEVPFIFFANRGLFHYKQVRKVMLKAMANPPAKIWSPAPWWFELWSWSLVTTFIAGSVLFIKWMWF
jgi:hypothetical protein